MKALYFTEHGELHVMHYGDVPDPAPGPGEVLVKVRACAVNHLDIWVRRGWPGLKLERMSSRLTALGELLFQQVNDNEKIHLHDFGPFVHSCFVERLRDDRQPTT